MGHKDYGPVLYSDPKSAQRAQRIRRRAGMPIAALAVFVGIFAALVPVFPQLVTPGIVGMMGLGIGSAVQVYVYWNWTSAVDVHADGLCFPVRTRNASRRTSFFVPFDQMAWVYANSSTPLLGIKVGLKPRGVQTIPLTMLSDPQPILASLRSRVAVVTTDPNTEDILRRLDHVPGAYAGLWQVRPANGRAQVLAAVTVFAVLGVGASLTLPVRSFDLFQGALVALPIIAAGLFAAWLAEKFTLARFRVASLWVRGVEDKLLLEHLSRFFAQSGQSAPPVELGGKFRGRRVYPLPANLGVLSTANGYEPGYGDVELRYPSETEAAASQFLSRFTRFAIEMGLIWAEDWRIGELLEGLDIAEQSSSRPKAAKVGSRDD